MSTLFSAELVGEAARECGVADLGHASIGEVILVARYLGDRTGIPVIRLDQGSPGLPPNAYGIEAEIEALRSGVASRYPAAGGVPPLKEAASRFVRAFLDTDISPRSCIPTTGSIAASFGAFIALTQRIPGKDKVLFLDPGFPMHRSQLRVLGIGHRHFDISGHRGAAPLRARLGEELRAGDIAAIVYSNPDNPAWTCLEEEELSVIGELATLHDAVVVEDLAYFCMDFRTDFGRPSTPPFFPTVSHYTDNYILLLSSSKIFSYAGQRMALCCIGDALYDKRYDALARRYLGEGTFGDTLVSSILYQMTSGATASTQYAYARMLDLACEGVIDFVRDTSPYARRASRMKELFTDNGFHIVYDRDVEREIGDGFFFTVGYGDMSGGDLVVELLRYGISSISISTTGGIREGVRVCSSMMEDDMFPLLEERLRALDRDHKTT